MSQRTAAALSPGPGPTGTPAPSASGLGLWVSHLVVPAALLLYAAFRAVVAVPIAGPLGWGVWIVGGAWLALGLGVLMAERGRGLAARHGAHALLLEGGALIALTGAELNLQHSVLAGERRQDPTELRKDDPALGWRLQPSITYDSVSSEFELRCTTNSRGHRDLEHAYAAAPGAHRIVVLGDSFMEAYQVELEQSLPRLLEAGLSEPGTEVINTGVRAYGSTQQYVMLRDEGLRYSPQLVIQFVFLGNDLRNNHLGLETHLWAGFSVEAHVRPYAHLSADGELVIGESGLAAGSEQLAAADRSRGYALERQSQVILEVQRWLRRRGSRGPSFDPNIKLGTYATRFDPDLNPHRARGAVDYRAMFEQAWEITGALLVATRDAARARGAEYAVVVVPPIYAADEQHFARLRGQHPGLELDRLLPSRWFAALAAEHDLHVLDLLPALSERYREGGDLPYHRLDRHWSPAGHRLATEHLIEFLRSERLLPVVAGTDSRE